MSGHRGHAVVHAPIAVIALLLVAFAIPIAATGSALAASATTISRISTSQKVILLTIDTDGIRGYMP